MTVYTLIHAPTGRTAAQVLRADGWWAKGRGVLGRPALASGAGLWLPGVASVHTLGVRFALDLVFLDRDFRTVRVVQSVPPNRWLVRAGGAAHTLELGAGTLAALEIPVQVGDIWGLERNDLPLPSVGRDRE